MDAAMANIFDYCPPEVAKVNYRHKRSSPVGYGYQVFQNIWIYYLSEHYKKTVNFKLIVTIMR